MKIITSILVGIVVIIGILWFIPKGNITKTDKTPPAEQTTQEQTTAQKTELIIGQKNAPVTLVEYGDFKCPSCNQFHRNAGQKLRQEYIDQGKLKIVYRNLPFIGPDSYRAAEGAYCANDQGKFTQYHDKVFNYMWDNYYSKGNFSSEFQDILTTNKLTELSDSIDIDPAIFSDCLNQRKFDQQVKADLKLSEKDTVTSTPFFIIDKQVINGPQPYNTFKTLVDIQLR